MGARNSTVTGFFLRKRITRHFILRFWDLICQVVVSRDLAATWQPTATPCHICAAPVERRARFCGVCGAAQVAGGPLATRGKRTGQETEEIQLVSAIVRQTEEIQRLGWVETKRLYPVRLGELTPSQQYQAQKHAWLHTQIRANYPDAEELIAAATPKGYMWLLDRLRDRGNGKLVERYNAWRPERVASHAGKK